MKSSSLHLNLLKPGEQLSSSPVRLRIMLPVGALLACAGLLVWWGILFTNLMMAKTQTSAIEDEYYKAGVRSVGEPLAQLAEVVPLRVQLRELSFTPPRPQVLLPPGAKVPLFGPVENVETQKLVIAGLTTKETPVVSLMESLESGFEKLVTSEHNVNSFRQDSAEAGGRKLLSFEVEYTMPERRFAK